MTHRIYSMSFASVYPHYLAKAEKGLKRTVQSDSAGFDPGRAKEQVDEMTVLACLGDRRARGHSAG